MSISTSSVYVNVIEDVVNKVRDEFMSSGPGEDVLKELQAIWETKMMQAGVINGPVYRSVVSKPAPGGPITPVHDLNVPYDGTDEYETPTAEILFPPTPLQTPIQTPLPGSAETNMYNIPTGHSDTPESDASITAAGGGRNAKGRAVRPNLYMQPSSPWMSQRPPLDVNTAYVEGRDVVDRGTSQQSQTQDFLTLSSGKRKHEEFATQYHTNGFIPQQDGAGDHSLCIFEIGVSEGGTSHAKSGTLTAKTRTTSLLKSKSSLKIPQHDGPIPDPYDDVLSTPNMYNYQGAYNEDYNIANTPAPNDLVSTPALAIQNEIVDDDDDEPPLNENDDDDLDDVDPGEDQNTQHLVLAQFDKVTRTKSRWKCTLKDGIMHINYKDILFNKATGEFEF